MRRLGEFFQRFRRNLYDDKAFLNQYLDHLSAAVAVGMAFPIYKLVKMYSEVPDKSEQTYVLIGNKKPVKQVEHHIRHQLGEPCNVPSLLKWKFSDIVSIKNEHQFERLKTEKKPINLVLCASTKTDMTKTNFWLPSNPADLPTTIEKRVIVVQDADDDQESVDNIIHRLRENQAILSIFKKSLVETVLEDNQQTLDLIIRVALSMLLASVPIILGTLIFVMRKRNVFFRNKIEK